MSTGTLTTPSINRKISREEKCRVVFDLGSWVAVGEKDLVVRENA